MEAQDIFRCLLDLAERLKLPIRQAPAGPAGSHPGGAVVLLKGLRVVFLDPDAALGDRMAVLAAALSDCPEIGGMFVPPEIRALFHLPGDEG
jgi:hypothetical protein